MVRVADIDDRDLLTVQEFAELFGISRKKVYNRIESGAVSAVVEPGTVRPLYITGAEAKRFVRSFAAREV